MDTTKVSAGEALGKGDVLAPLTPEELRDRRERQRARELYRERGEDFRYLGERRWLVPSRTVEGRFYVADLAREAAE